MRVGLSVWVGVLTEIVPAADKANEAVRIRGTFATKTVGDYKRAGIT